MSLNIKNEEAERLARRVAAATGESVTRAVTVALQDRLNRLHDEQAKDRVERIARIRAIVEDSVDRWKEPYRSADHGELLYDESGLPPVIVDTSAIIAILLDEPEADRYVEALVDADPPRISAGTYLETCIVVDANRDPVLGGRLDDLVATAGLKVEPFTPRHAAMARQAYRDFGKGSGHPAGLNLGDCFAYALARESGEPLLYKGDDFGHTDVAPALPPT